MAASSSSASSQEIKYDVFISFRGEDVRNNFLGHLQAALCRKSIQTFADDQLNRGDDITVCLLNTIKASKISVIIFSKTFADSKWCLQELEQILDCKRTRGQIVIPIFYKIDPSNVRHQNGRFGARFAEFEKRLIKRSYDLEGLKDALVDAAHLSDWTIDDRMFETLSMDAIVGDILKKLNILKFEDGTSGAAYANKLKECLEKRLDDLNNLKADLQRWKAALEEAANLSGYTVNDSKSEIILIDEAVKDILEKLNKMSTNDNKDLVGVELSIKKVESLLRVGSNGVRVHVIGIWGIGGIGKTTIGHAVFNKILNQFECSCFAEDVREKSEKSIEQNSLRQEILFKILEDRDADINHQYTIERLGRKKVLLAFDDLTSYEQIENLIGDFQNLGFGSRIIITTRDKQVLRACGLGDDDIYELKGLSYPNALQLFGRYAFRKNCPVDEDFADLSNKMVLYTKGVPLALKVLGSSLHGGTKEVWESEWMRLKEYPNQDIQKVLRRSYEGLDSNSQSIFLDITCFFKGWKTYIVKDILNASGLRKLIDKSLVSISDDNTIGMHDLIQEMGRYIVREESDLDPGQRSRLWDSDDISKLFRKNMGTSKVLGIFFDTSVISRHVQLKSDAFAKMCNLRLLQVHDNNENKFSGVEQLESLPCGLTYFYWEAYPSRSLPSDFFAEDLVRLNMRSSNLEQLWDDVQDLKKLKYVNLSYSTQLKRIPDLSKAKKLQELILNGCTSLENIDSIQYLNELVNLDLSKCDSLSIVPDGTVKSTFVSFRGCSNLMVAPKISRKVEKLDLSGTAIIESPFIDHPSRLTSLDLSDCSKLESLLSSICKCILLKSLKVNACPKLKWLPNDLGNLEELEILDASGSNLIELPPSIAKLSKLDSLWLSRGMDQERPLNWSLTSLSGFKFLVSLKLANCGITMLPDDLGQLYKLRDLDLSGNNFKSMPAMNNLHHFVDLDISYCESLTSLPELPKLLYLRANNCSSLTTISNLSFLLDVKFAGVNFANCLKLNLSEMLHKEPRPTSCYQDQLCYPGNEIPNWFSLRNEGSSITLDQRPFFYKKRILGLSTSAVVAFPEGYSLLHGVRVNVLFLIKRGDDKFFMREGWMDPWLPYGGYIKSDHVILLFEQFGFWLPPICIRCLKDKIQIGELGDSEVMIKFSAGDLEVKECGFHVLLGQEEEDKPHWRTPFPFSEDIDDEHEGDSPWHLDDENEEGEELEPKRLKICDPSSVHICLWCCSMS